MDAKFWTERWNKNEIGFHQREANDLLTRHWPVLGVPKGAKVFVPLAGKSLDMAWLAAQGYRVVGSELSELAIDAFLSGEGLVPAESYSGLHVVKRAAPYELWLGDFFALPKEAFRDVAAVYDRAALIAMPRTMQQLYAEKLALLAPPGADLLLVTIEYDPSEMNGPPFPITADRVRELLAGPFEMIGQLQRRDGMPKAENLKARGLSWVAETVYHLRRRPA